MQEKVRLHVFEFVIQIIKRDEENTSINIITAFPNVLDRPKLTIKTRGSVLSNESSAI